MPLEILNVPQLTDTLLEKHPGEYVLVISAVGGLGSRIPGLVSAHKLAAANGYPLYVHWPIRKHPHHHYRFEAPLQQLWIPKSNCFTFVSDRSWNSLLKAPTAQFFLRNMLAKGKLYPSLTWGIVHGPVDKEKKTNNYYASQRDFFRKNYTVTVELEKGIQYFSGKFKIHECVGLQLRCRGSKNCRQWGAETQFSNFIKRQIKKEPDTRFFLSSDDLEVTVRIVNQFGSRISHIRKRQALNTLSGLKNAVTDLELLALCRNVRATPRTGFAVAACLICGSQLPTP